MEGAVIGIDGFFATVQLYYDGVLSGQLVNQPLFRESPYTLYVGEPQSNTGFFGQVDFDDIRVDTSPLASRLALSTPPAPIVEGSCIPLEVEMHSTMASDDGGVLAVPPYDLTLSFGAFGTFLDAQCTQPASTPQLSADASSSRIWFRVPVQTQVVVPVADTGSDFLPGAVTLSPVPPDGGFPDAGPRTPDGGMPDGSVADAGPAPTAPLFLTDPPDSASCGTVYSYDESVSGTGPFAFKLESRDDGGLPDGLTCDVDTGAIRWSPSASQEGIYHLELQVFGPGGLDSKNVDISVFCPDTKDLSAGCHCGSGGGGLLALLSLVRWRKRRRSSSHPVVRTIDGAREEK